MAPEPDVASDRVVAPRNAASLVIVECGPAEPRVLLGKRRPTQTFAPGKYVFPGGGLDPSDSELATSRRLAEHDRFALSRDPGPESAHLTPEAFALAAIRETFEETGLVIGSAGPETVALAPAAWRPLVALGVGPNIEALSFIARAITPPGRPRRFDARFFIADAAAISHRVADNDGEFEQIDWFGFAAARALDLHGMTRSILNEAQRFMALSASERSVAPVPFYFESDQGWHQSRILRQANTLGT